MSFDVLLRKYSLTHLLNPAVTNKTFVIALKRKNGLFDTLQRNI